MFSGQLNSKSTIVASKIVFNPKNTKNPKNKENNQ
jgi:hypothetical protein